MTPEDEAELHRLTNMLAALDASLPTDKSSYQEAIRKAAFALSLVYNAGQRGDVDMLYSRIGQPLSAEEEAYLRSQGIRPNA